ncbi:MAG: nucleotide exchange factor GrpE [Chloroflexi bacterium]|jgi:molecular chaperone GrpE|nr:nucleotide exchange factor GrpE [Chloroflexota bacterium]
MTEEHKKRESKRPPEPEINKASEAETLDTNSNESLSAELEKVRAQSQEYFEGWQRERADFANYKKRIERDQIQMAQIVNGNIIKKYLVVMDDLERALKARPTEGEGAKWAEGIDLIYRKFQNILENENVKRIPADAAEFDPNLHEAISHEDSPDHESGQVIEVLQQGYMIGDRVLRPALVRVAK